jgi:FkbM family methyltransferase
MKNRTISLINSAFQNGVFKTLMILFSILLLKLRVRDSIKIFKNKVVYLRNGTSDISVFRQIFLDNEYSFYIQIKNPSFIIDLGANIGLFSLFIKNKYPEATVIALEPEPSNFELLEKNTKNYKNIITLQKAIWKDNNGVTLNINPEYGEWGCRVSEVEKGNNEVIISSITMNDIIINYNIDTIDILKIDIEAAEKYIFEGEISWLKKVKVLVIELHDFMDENSSNNFFKSINNLEPFNFFIHGENLVFVNTRTNW